MTSSHSADPSNAGQDLFKGIAKKKTAKRGKQEVRPQIQVGEYGRYLIKSGLLAGRFVARAFPKPPTTARGLIAEASGPTEDAAIIALHDMIDARENHRAEIRRTDSLTGKAVPSVEEFVEAIGQVTLTLPQRVMLAALSQAGAEGMTEAHMAHAGSYKSEASAKRSLASAGQSMAAYLASGTISSGKITGSDGILFLGFRDAPRGDEGTERWILHPEMRDAVEAAL